MTPSLLAFNDLRRSYYPSEVYNTAIVLTHWGRTDANHRSCEGLCLKLVAVCSFACLFVCLFKACD